MRIKTLLQAIKYWIQDNQVYMAFILACLPVMIYRDYTPGNELRYLSIADEAIHRGLYFTFSNHGIVYADKPPLYFWIIMFGKWMFGKHCMFFLSLFSMIPALLIGRVMDRWTVCEMPRDDRHTAQLLLLSCGLFAGMAIVLRMDMLMSLFIILSLREFFYWQVDKSNDNRYVLRFSFYIFMGLFSKGPLGLLIPFCVSLAFLITRHRSREIRRYWGWKTWGLLAIGCTCWFAAVYREGGMSYLYNMLGYQIFGRAIHAFHHQEPFYYYVVASTYSFLPWSLLFLFVCFAVIQRGHVRTELQYFLQTAFVTTFLVLSLISAKLAVYMLPLFPFVVYWVVMNMHPFRDKCWLVATLVFPSLLFCLSLPAFVFYSLYTHFRLLIWLLSIVAGILTMAGLYALCLLYHKKVRQTIQILALSLWSGLFVLGFASPQINPYIGYGALCTKATQVAKSHGIVRFYAWHVYRAENMDVYLGHPVHIVVSNAAPDNSRLSGGSLLFIPRKELHAFPHRQAWNVGSYAIVLFS